MSNNISNDEVKSIEESSYVKLGQLNKDSYIVNSSISAVISSVTAVADQLAGKANKSEMLIDVSADIAKIQLKDGLSAEVIAQHQQLEPIYGGNGERFGEWGNFVCSGDVPPTDFYVQWTDEYIPACWGLFIVQGDEGRVVAPGSTNVNSTNEVFDVITGTVTATRTENPIVGYKLGSQDTKPLQPQGNYLTSVPVEYKTYAETSVTLSNDGYVVSTQLTECLTDIDGKINDISSQISGINSKFQDISTDANISSFVDQIENIGLDNIQVGTIVSALYSLVKVLGYSTQN